MIGETAGGSTEGFSSSLPLLSITRLSLLSGLVMPVIMSVDLLSGLSFGLLLGFPNTSLNLLAGEMPRSLLMLSLRGFGLRVSARSIKPAGDEGGFGSGTGGLLGEGDPSVCGGSTKVGILSMDRTLEGLWRF